MTTTAPLRLSGIVPPVVTPFTGGQVDVEALRTLVDRLVTAGVDGLFALGSSAEVAYLTDADRDLVVQTVVEAAAGRVPVVVGCIDLTAERVVQHGLRAARLGADGIVVTPPFYALNSVEETLDHFRRVAAGVPLPVIAYDVPVRVHMKLTVPLVMQLAQEGLIVGLKDSSGDDISFRRLVAANRAAGGPLTLLTGHEIVCDAMFLAGADGAVPGLANVDPEGYVRLWQAAQRSDWEAARVEQERLNALFEIVFCAPGRSGDAAGVGAFKAAMATLGSLPSGEMAYPVRALDGESLERIVAITREWQAYAGTPA